MALMQRLEMRQGQSLVMTPQLLQAIKLLQLSHLELAAYVEAELERNPLLERVDGDGDAERDGPTGLDAAGEDGREARRRGRASRPSRGSRRDLQPDRSAMESGSRHPSRQCLPRRDPRPATGRGSRVATAFR